jgi:L-lactate dehydrogenase complex protein LldG
MSARENILHRIRSRLGRPAVPAAEEREAVQAHLSAHPASPRPRVEGELQARFRSRAESLTSTVEEVGGVGLAPAAIARYLARNALGSSAVCWPEFAALDWRAAGLDVQARPARDGDLVGITGAFCAIAETGTLMLLSGPRTPAAASLLPETHIAVLRAARIVRGMEEAWSMLRAEVGVMPRAVNFVSGPSRTADIEQTVTLGAHGPYRVHIVLTGD